MGLYEVTLSTGAVASRYKHTDALGSPVATTDAAKAVLSRTSYTPYGVPTLPVDGVGYTGHFIDVNTSLTYMQQRYYDPQLGRFLSIDPMAVDTSTSWNFNRYNYAANNPYRFTDPDGRMTAEDRMEMVSVRNQQRAQDVRNARSGNGAGQTRSETKFPAIGPNYSVPGQGVSAKAVVSAGSTTTTVVGAGTHAMIQTTKDVATKAASKDLAKVLGPAGIVAGVGEIITGDGFAEKGHGFYSTILSLTETVCEACATFVIPLQLTDLGVQLTPGGYTGMATEGIERLPDAVLDMKTHPMER